MINKLRKDRTTRKGWIKKLDKLVSEIVVARDGQCVVCGSKEKLGCGHLLTRGAYATRWNLINCNCQCWADNFSHEMHPEKYTLWFLKHFGKEMYEELVQLHRTTTHYKTFDLQAMYEELMLIKSAYKHGTKTI